MNSDNFIETYGYQDWKRRVTQNFLFFSHSNLLSHARAQVFLTKLKIGMTDEATCISKQSYLEREIESEIVIEKQVMVLHIFKAKYCVLLELIHFHC
jgi:hypothetical protein